MGTNDDAVNIELKHAVSKIRFGTEKPPDAAFGTILSPLECIALWEHLSGLGWNFKPYAAKEEQRK